MSQFVKRREPARPGTIAYALGMFGAEVRFYREIAPVVGVRVPECHVAEDGPDGTRLVLEDLSAWTLGADPVAAARVLARLHGRWERVAPERWPWLRPAGAAGDLVAELYDRRWTSMSARTDLTTAVRELGDRLRGRVPEAIASASAAGPLTLVHGDVSARNMRTGPDGEIALLDWEDVGASAGVTDLAWLLLSSIPVERWDETIAAYGAPTGLDQVFPAIAVQALLSFGDTTPGRTEAHDWLTRLTEAARRLRSS